jgi:hypothetical protein
MWSVTVAGLCVLWFAAPAGAVPLESWDDNIANPNLRFRALSKFNGAAVLDKNTGLVWEQAVDSIGGQLGNGRRTWSEATSYCVNKTVGGTVGWRLPSVVELRSVQDPSLSPPYVPASVFTGVGFAHYWSASAFLDHPTLAWVVDFVDGGAIDDDKTDFNRVWCVRGGMNADTY